MKLAARAGLIRNQYGGRPSRPIKHPLRAEPKILRECIALSDPTDCLLEAYDCVTKRAYEKFLSCMDAPEKKLEDWLKDERDRLPDIPVSFQEYNDCLYALASVPGAGRLEVSVGIESRWLVIIVDAGSHDYPVTLQSEKRVSEPRQPDAGRSAARQPGARRSNSCQPDTRQSGARQSDVREAGQRIPEDAQPAQSVCVSELRVDVDPARSIAVLSDGLLAIRMPKLCP